MRALALLALLAGCDPVLELEVDPCPEIAEAKCTRAVECEHRGGIDEGQFESCLAGMLSVCHRGDWYPEPECVQDTWSMECEPEMPLPCSCGSGTPGCR